jgi:hypothetical protein
MRGGITTGFECESMFAAGCTSLGSDLGIDGGVLVGIGSCAAFTVRGDGEILWARVPIFSGLERGDGGECCRYG